MMKWEPIAARSLTVTYKCSIVTMDLKKEFL